MSYAIIRPKRGTASEWSAANPILKQGEMGIEAPKEGVGCGMSRVKFGDGTRAWNDLPYAICPESYFSGDSSEFLKKSDLKYTNEDITEISEKATSAFNVSAQNAAALRATLPTAGGTITGNLNVNGTLNGMKLTAGIKILTQGIAGRAYARLFSKSEIDNLLNTSGSNAANTVVYATTAEYGSNTETSLADKLVCYCSSSNGDWYVATASGNNIEEGKQFSVSYIVIKF